MTHEEQFRGNLKHAFELFDVLLDDPSQLAEIPGGLTVVLMPSDDPELCEANDVVIRADRLQSAAPHGDPDWRLSLSRSTLLVNV